MTPTARIIIKKSYPIEGGKLSGMFSAEVEDVTEESRIALIRMEGKICTVTLSDAPEAAQGPAEGEPETIFGLAKDILADGHRIMGKLAKMVHMMAGMPLFNKRIEGGTDE